MKLELKTSTGSKTQLKIELIFITLKQQMIHLWWYFNVYFYLFNYYYSHRVIFSLLKFNKDHL